MSRTGAMALRDAVLDEGSFISWDTTPLDVGADPQYRRELAEARAETGLDESVLTGGGTVCGRRVAVLLGPGSGGPALAMVPADRVLAALHGWLAPLPPEGASAIVFRDVAHAPELAAAQGIRSADLLRNGIVDVIVPEHTDAADTPSDFTRRLSATIATELHALRALTGPQRLASRLRHYRGIGLSS